MATDKLCAALDAAESEYRRQEDLFDSNTSRLEREAIMPTSVRLGTLDQQLTFNLNVVQKFADATKKHCAACDALILALDAAARPLLEKKVTAQEVGEVARFMQEVESDVAGIDINFGMSFDGLDLGSVGSFRPMLCTAAQAIVMFWKNHYRSMPGYQKDQARLKAIEQEKRDAELRRKQEQEARCDAKKLNAIEKIEKARQMITLKENVRQQCDRLIDKFESQLAAAEKDCRMHLLKVEKERLQEEAKKAEENFANLKLFDFQEKKRIRGIIKSCKKSLARLNLPQDLSDRLAMVTKTEAQHYRKTVNKYFEKRFVLVETFWDVTYFGNSRLKMEMMESFYSVLTYTPQTIKEIAQKCNLCEPLCSSSIRWLLQETPYVIRTVPSDDWTPRFAFNPEKVNQIELWKDTKPNSEIPLPSQEAKELFSSFQ